jgi:predicted nucleic acid-binding protein
VVVDASVAVKWFFTEPFADAAEILLGGGYQLLAPELLVLEVGSALWKRQRRRELDGDTASRILRDLERAPIEMLSIGKWGALALDLAVRYGITVYDGLYLAVATGHECSLVTADRRLFDACVKGGATRRLTWVEDVRR